MFTILENSLYCKIYVSDCVNVSENCTNIFPHGDPKIQSKFLSFITYDDEAISP